MDNSNEITVAKPRADGLYRTLLFLYPESYRKRFGQEMLFLFYDLYKEELAKRGNIGVGFWVSICLDSLQSAMIEHLLLMKKQGIKTYLQQTWHINRYNVIGGILLMPFFLMFIIDLVSRIMQGDLTHYNRPVYALLSHTPLYWTPVLFTIMIIFPLLAILSNVVPILMNISKKHAGILSWSFVRRNSISLLLVSIALGFIAIVRLHDFAPCMMHGILKVGVGRLPEIIAVCKNA